MNSNDREKPNPPPQPDFQGDFVVEGQDDGLFEKVVESRETQVAAKAGWVGALTLLSRLFGLARDSVIAYVLGTKAAADAFYVALRIPNLLRRMFAEGNLTLSFIPVFTESLHRSRREAREVADVTFTLMLFILVAVSLLGVVGASFFVRLTALGFTEDPEKFALTVSLTRITFPYLLFVSIGALMMGILNARKHFITPALAPVFMNVGIIFGALVLSRFFDVPSVGIAWGVIVGGVLQILIQVPVLIRHGFLPRLSFNFKMPAVRKIGRLMLPTLWGSAAYQINLLGITFMASFLPTGSVSYLWYADRVIEFPLGIFAISLATVTLPTLSDQAAQKKYDKMRETFRGVLSMVWLLNVPAAVGLAVLAKPILALLFYRGGFGVESTLLTARTLVFFAIGLPFVSASRITISAFYAVQEAKRPVWAANITVLVTIFFGAVLLFPLQHRGLALAVSLGSIVNFLLLMIFYRRQRGPLGLKSLSKDVAKILLAAALMGAALVGVQRYWDLSFAPFWPRLGFTFAMMGIGLAVYLPLVWIMKVRGLESFLQALRRRMTRSQT
jgi:putative peptidoglycan lipid II flippase